MNRKLILFSISMFSFSLQGIGFDVFKSVIERKQNGDDKKKVIQYIGKVKMDNSKEVWEAIVTREWNTFLNPVLNGGHYKAKLKNNNHEQQLSSWDASTLFAALSNGYAEQEIAREKAKQEAEAKAICWHR